MPALGIDPAIPRQLSGAALAGALARYAELMQPAAAELAREWRRPVWLFFADALKGTKFPVLGDELPPHVHASQAALRAHQRRRVGDRCLLTLKEVVDLTEEAARARADARAKEACDFLGARTAVHGAAALAAVRWFWAHEAQCAEPVEWWLPHVRTRMARENKEKGVVPGGTTLALFSDEDDEEVA